MDTSTSAYLYHSNEAPVTSGSITVQNFAPGVPQGGFYTDSGGGVSTFSENADSVSSPGTSVTAEHDVLLQGVATGAGANARAWYAYNTRTTLQTISDATTLGTLVTITGLTEATDLSLLMTLDYLLATADSGGSTTWADMYWTVTYSTKPSGNVNWGAWQPSCSGGSSYFCGQTPFGDENYAAHQGPYVVGGAFGSTVVSGTDEYDITTTLAAGTDYRFRLALSVRGIADSVNSGIAPDPFASAVPLPAALPMLGAAMAGLGLFAARRRKS
ncbi:VPLPA-CTERM sorting domain-containing protein [Albimonas pacifica]|uniref:VPLPA-CTERM sorting domain-containing protein n=1 Tax=Albimonas pacifica TaxID=1114924 RepID=UPI0011608CB7|nr:VPLPA-CTERM sorting domain-containing protein [Albimonas pacifica]